MKSLERGLALALAVVLSFTSVAVADNGWQTLPPLSTSIPKAAVRAYVTDTIDGDTVLAYMNGRREKVRMKGVDTPETVAPHTPVQPWGKASSKYTREQLLHKYVWIETAHGAKHDMFGRLLAYVYLADGSCHNETLVLKGLGRVQRHYKFDRIDQYDQIEKKAKQDKVGIWS